MNYNIKGTGLDLTDELRGYVEKKLGHADKFVGAEPAHADVELEHKPLDQREQYRAEFTVAVGGTVYRAEAQGGAMHEAIDIATAELTRELTRGKKKRLHTFRRGAARVKDYLRGWRSRP